jgi:crotonobetainyl-CoA:carnitine CoA-transferase CaiB-like acyl-CoA transferase
MPPREAPKAGREQRRRPLDGVRIVDCTHAMAGPYATSLMGDLGADVVKVESPTGDFIRAMDENLGPGRSSYFWSINRSKRSIVLDLRTDEGQAMLDGLLSGADVFITNLRHTAIESLGIGYERVRAANPATVYCAITGFGGEGPKRDLPGLDLVGQAVSGIMGMTGEYDGPPIKAGPSMTDVLTAYLGCFGILAALRARDRDGQGQKVELNLADSGLSAMPNLVTEYLATGAPLRPHGSGHPQAVPYQAFAASDGYFVLACLSDRLWQATCRGLERPDLATDDRYLTATGRLAHREELVTTLGAWFRQRPRDHWLARLEASGVPCGPVNRLEDAVLDPQFAHNRMLRRIADPRVGDYTVVSTPIRFSDVTVGPTRPAPGLGEHTEEVLAEIGCTSQGTRAS